MTNKEVSKLGKKDLLEILYFMRKEIDALKDENDMLKTKIEEETKNDKLSDALERIDRIEAKLDFIMDKFK